MNEKINIEDRIPIWMALSEFYLDTELQQLDYQYISSIFSDSPYDLNEIKRINKYEVFPVLWPNLISVAGIWQGFNKDHLISRILNNQKNKSSLQRLWIKNIYRLFESSFKNCWEEIENAKI